MYILEDLDEPIKVWSSTIKNLENGKEYFHAGVVEIAKQICKIQDVLESLQRKISGKEKDLEELTRRINIIEGLSLKFNQLLDDREIDFMSMIYQRTPILPS